MKSIKKIILLFSDKEKFLILLILLLSILNMFLDIFSIGILIPLFASLTGQINFENEFFNLILGFLKNQIFKETSFIAFIIISIFLLKNIILLLQKWFENKVSYDLYRKNSRNLFDYYISKNYLFHLKVNSAELIKNIQNECSLVSFNILRPFLSIISLLISTLTILIFLIGINPKITLLTMFFLSLIGFFFSNFTKKLLKKLGNDRQLHSRLSLKNLQQTFTSIREIIISNKKDFFLSIFDFHNKKNLNSSFKSNFIYSIPRSIIEISIVLLISVIIIYLKNSNISFSEIILTLTIFVVGAARLMPSISAIFSNLSSLVYYNNATNIFSNEFFNFIKKKKILISEKQINFRIIKYKNISFNYPGKKKKIISNLNFEFKFNDKVGIIGDTGSGKSTLVNIISGLLKSTNGEIFIDGLKVNNLNEQWFNTISYVPQNVLTLDENFKNNIILGAKKINHQHFNKITKILDLNEIKKKYLNTRTIGERGSRISGGQNQRIGLARAFYKNSKILILDESLSSIHIKLRDRILKNIFEMYKNKLVILVSHQLDALKKFDKILKIEKGKIIRIK